MLELLLLAGAALVVIAFAKNASASGGDAPAIVTSGDPSSATSTGYGTSGYAYATSVGSTSYSQSSVSVSGDSSGSDQDILARTIYGEASNQSDAAKQGVGATVRNRVNDPLSFPYGFSYAAQCQASGQYDCWTPGSANFNRMQGATMDDSAFQDCYTIAGNIISGALADNTGGATMYHDTSIATPASWSRYVFTVQIGAFLFFKLGGL